jgi:hypothetical protein
VGKRSTNLKITVTPKFFIPFSPEHFNTHCRNKKVYLVACVRQNCLFAENRPRRARAKTKNIAQFSDWLNEEPAFANLRGTPEFGAIREASAQH